MSDLDPLVKSLQSKIGHEIGVSDWLRIDQTVIDRFADATMDHQFIHVDPVRAKNETPFGGTIAHGFLTLSLASKFSYECIKPCPGQSMGVNYGFNKIRFLAPVKAGSNIRARFALRSLDKKSDTEVFQTMDLTIEIEGEAKPALVAEWLTLLVF
ncbi:MAG: MaoC family dehydratase [Rhizobiaceae bacterium]